MKTDNESLITQYLLGELSEEQQLRLEEDFFKSDEAFEQLRMIEDELRYDYAVGGLKPAQRSAFEKRFLQYSDEAQRVRLANAVMEKVGSIKLTAKRAVEEQPGILARLLGVFGLQMPAVQFAMAAASILILAGSAWLLYRTTQLRSQVKEMEVATVNREQEQLKQLAEERSRSDKLEAALESERRQRDDLAREIEQQRVASRETRSAEAPAPLSFALSPGQLRGADGPKRLVVTSGLTTLRVQLRLRQPSKFTGYQVGLQTTDGAQIWDRMVPRGVSSGMVSFNLAARLVPPGDYVLTLKGRTAAGVLEEIDDYYFTVGRE